MAFIHMLDLWDTAPLVWGVRLALEFVVLYNCIRSFHGLRNLFRGKRFHTSVLDTGIFLLGLGTLAMNSLLLLGGDVSPSSVWALASLTVSLGGNACIAYYYHSGIGRKTDHFYSFYPHVDKALPLVELFDIDPKSAEAIHRLAVKALVARLVSDSTIARHSDRAP